MMTQKRIIPMMSTQLSPPSKYHFSGHETFPFRYSWLTKGVQNLEKFPDLFSRDDAIVVLGTGKNMVRSIRHWCSSMNLIQEKDRSTLFAPTILGESLFGIRGWDPYLEDAGTLWLLHWLLLSRIDRASTWHLAFTQWSQQDFTSDDLVRWILSVIPSEKQASVNSLERDVEVFIRTYVPKSGTEKNVPAEDTFDCPLVELGLIQDLGKGLYRFMRGPKPSLPDAIFHYALVNFWNTYWPNQKTISFESLLNGAGSPGTGFKLSEDDLCERLENLPDWIGMTFDETAGMRQVLLTKDLKNIQTFVALRKYYGKKR